MPSVEKNGEPDLVWGIFIIGAIFLGSAFVALWLLAAMGWNPLSSGIYFYAGMAISFYRRRSGCYGYF